MVIRCFRLRWVRQVAGICLWLGLASCSHIPSPAERTTVADELAIAAGWSSLLLPTTGFHLQAWAPSVVIGNKVLTVYLEGDGLAWLDESTTSVDPTPLNPLALRLAVKHNGAVAYLARPCQFVAKPHRQRCVPKYWTSHRFAPEVIDATNQALDRLKNRWGASQLELVGYSGGGAVAALAAAQRQDVVRLITVAGNLDHATWTKLKRLSPLNGSMNPVDVASALQNIPQWHLVGGFDRIMPPTLAHGYAARFLPKSRPNVVTVGHFDHWCCWVDAWTPNDPNSLVGQAFLRQTPPQ